VKAEERTKLFLEEINKVGVKSSWCMYERGRYYFQLELVNGDMRYWSIKANGDNDKEFKNKLNYVAEKI
jgi:hypothetical protein